MTTSRRDSAKDSCKLIVGLAENAAGKNTAARVRVNRYIATTPLRNCTTYANRVVKGN